MSILGTIALAAVGTLIPGAGIAIAITNYGKEAVVDGLKSAATWLFVHPMALVAIVAVLFGLWQLHGKHTAEAQIPALKRQAANSHDAFMLEKKAFATEKASLDGALVQINDNNKRVEAANAALEHARVEAAAANARADERYAATKGAVARLEASAAAKGGPPCKVSQEALKALDGL